MSETRTRRRGVAPLILAAAALAACDSDPTGPEPIEETIFVDALGIDLADFTETPSGVWVRDDVVGEGPAAEQGDSLVMAYRVWRPNGTLLDQGQSYRIRLGVTSVIEGFEVGLSGEGTVPAVREGGTRTFIIPHDLAYGDSVLVFEVVLSEVRPPADPPGT